jgi:hypothetical protein
MLLESGVAQNVVRPSTVRQAQVDSCPGRHGTPSEIPILSVSGEEIRMGWNMEIYVNSTPKRVRYVGDDVQNCMSQLQNKWIKKRLA